MIPVDSKQKEAIRKMLHEVIPSDGSDLGPVNNTTAGKLVWRVLHGRTMFTVTVDYDYKMNGLDKLPEEDRP